MIRFYFLNAFIALHSIIFCIWSIILSLFDRQGRIVHFYGAAPWSRITLWVCGIKVIVKGRENLDQSAARIYLTNHQSYFDIFTLLGYLPVDFKFILKQELMRIPLLGTAMRGAGYIGIERGDPRKAIKSMRKAGEKLGSGSSLVLFPEGTRGTDGRLLPFKKGGFRLALKSGVDVVPVVICNSYRIVPKGSLKINRGTITLHIGRPISVKEYSKGNITQLMDRVRDEMLRLLEDTGSV